MKSHSDLYQVVSDRIVTALSNGTIPWIAPWQTSPDQAFPANLSSGHQYRGINVLLLNLIRSAQGYRLNRWLTFQQARALGGHVRRGESGTEVVFFKMLEVDDAKAPVDASRKVVPLLRSFTVFNAAQMEGLPPALVQPPVETEDFDRNAAAEVILQGSGAVIHHGGDQAFYRPADDSIYLPDPATFVSADRYYGIALHELTHWSGHASRCNRVLSSRRNLDAYAFEELIAEMGAAFLCNQCGIHTELQHAGYIQSWLQALQSDKRLIFAAASQAQKAADYLLSSASQAPVPVAAAMAA